MKINRVSVLVLLCVCCWQAVSKESKSPPASWQSESRSVYDLLVAQMQNASADFGGSVDALVKYAKEHKDEQLYFNAYTALLRTKRYADAVKLIKDWQSEAKLKLDKYYVLALVLNGEIDLAITTIDKSLADLDDIKSNPHLFAYLRVLVTHWYDKNVLAVLLRLYERYDENESLAITLVKQLRWQGETDKAVKIVDKALFSDPKNVALLQEKSDIYRYALQLDKASEVWESILKDYPNDSEFQFAYARFLFDRYDFVLADKRLAAIEPKTEQRYGVNLLHAMTKIQLNDYQSAKTVIDWQKFDEEEKNRMNYDIGSYLLEADQVALAKDYFEAVEATDKTSPLALAVAIKMGEIHYHSDLEKGNQWFDEVAEKFKLSDAEILKDQANALREAGLDQASYDLLTTYLDANPNNEDMRYLRGLVAAEMYKEKIAAEDLGIIHAKSPDNADVQNALGYTLLATADGDVDKLKVAGKLIKKALFVQPDSPAVVDSMGWLLYQQKSYDESLPYLRFAYANYSDGEIIGHYIAALEKSGQYQLAKKLYQLEIKYPPHQEKINYYTETIKERLLP